ncbi:MAG: AAA family ATPase [Chloroflexota bacterium]
MRIARLILHNVKSYAGPTTIELEPGINAVCGENGAGKSTILEALGFTLFGYKPYRLDAFLREGEKSGSITVTVEDDQGCSFDVVRKLGSSAGQAVYDELNQKVAEGDADVRNWLLGFFRLEPGTDLAKLFEDTVGPPQGTLTAIFLESAGPRSKKFDRLLQIEDYPAAAQALRAVSNLFRDQAVEAEKRAALLEGDARRLPETEERQREVALREADLKVAVARAQQRQAELAAVWERLERARQAVQRAQAELEVAGNRTTEAQRRREEQAAELRRAEEAVRQLEASRPGYEAYQEATERLRKLNERRQERDRLRQSAEIAGRAALRWEQERLAAAKRLAELDRDEAHAAEREQLLPEQESREAAVRQAEERVRSREEARRQLPGAEERLAAAGARLQEARGRLAEVEAAGPAASRLEELRSRDRSLREGLARLEQQGWVLKQAGDDLGEAHGRLQQLQRETERLQGEAATLRPLQAVAALAAGHQRERDYAHGDLEALRARHQEALRSRGQVEGGLCPFFHEPCKNLRPGLSLDDHFDRVIAEVAAAIERAQDRLVRSEAELAEARSAERGIARLPDLEARLGQLAEERAGLEGEAARLDGVLRELADTPQRRAETLEALRALEPELGRAEAALQLVSGEPGWRRQAEEATQAMEREQQGLAELRETVEREAGAADALVAAQARLKELGDPRAEVAALRQRIARERPEAERALERAGRESAAARAAEEKGQKALEPFARLEEEMAAAGRLRDENEEGHRRFLENQGEASRLEQRRLAHQRAVSEAEQAAVQTEAARAALEKLQAAYDEAEQQRLRRETEEVAAEIASGQRELELCGQDEERLLREIAALRQRKSEMEAAQGQAAESRRLMETVEAVRRALDAAGPEIGRALLRRISARATAIYRDLLGQPTVSLEWGSDYEIRCRIRAEEREFKQLSGGEQMAAALAVRLALLQTLSNLRLAFLDEPTAHMDAVRRTNLAAQIQNLRSFDQLLVISHDDSFDTLFGHVVRLAKQGGATVVED